MGKTFLQKFGCHETFVTIATRACIYISPILNRILAKLGRLALQMKISRRGMWLRGKLVTMATIVQFGYHSNCK